MVGFVLGLFLMVVSKLCQLCQQEVELFERIVHTSFLKHDFVAYSSPFYSAVQQFALFYLPKKKDKERKIYFYPLSGQTRERNLTH